MLTRSIVARLARSRLLARLLFGGGFPELPPGDRYFDATTLALRSIVARRVPRGARLLDIGTGGSAVLALWAWRRRGARVVATDPDPEAARGAERAVRVNGAPIPVVCCSLLDAVRGEFDCALFNPPYVPTSVGLARSRLRERRSRWDGGGDGARVVAAFVRSLAARGRIGRTFLGVNRRYVPRAEVEAIVDGTEGLRIEEVARSRWLPVNVYVLVSK